MKKISRRAILLSSGAALGLLVASRYRANLPSQSGIEPLSPKLATGSTVLNDASELNATRVHKHIILRENPDIALINRLRKEIGEARKESRPVCVSAARHSMGGQSIPKNGHAIEFKNGLIEVDSSSMTYTAHAGARWSDVIRFLDPLGLSPTVMQSNNDFGVAATFCVNAHGWPFPFGPMGSTVRSFRMILPDGELVNCSRDENQNLFFLTMGGYGLTGAIVDLEISMLPNQKLIPVFEKMQSFDLGKSFLKARLNQQINMAYGRMNVDRDEFCQHALMVTYHTGNDQNDLPPASGSGWTSKLSRHIYRFQLGNERMKKFRWWTETDIAPRLTRTEVTRNSLINEPVATLDDRDPKRADILHEYFVAPEKFPDFVLICQQIIPNSYQEFLNITLRYVNQDDESYLSYATTPRIAAVMSFSQEKTKRAEADMRNMTKMLIDAITELGGSYYLPYRQHPSVKQFEKVYPKAGDFALEKRQLDPNLVFRNNLWDTYLDKI